MNVQTVEFSSRSITILSYMDWTVDRKFSKVKVTFVSLDFALTHAHMHSLSLLAERLSAILLVVAQSDVLQAPSSWFAPLDGRPEKWKRLIALHALSTVKLNLAVMYLILFVPNLLMNQIFQIICHFLVKQLLMIKIKM